MPLSLCILLYNAFVPKGEKFSFVKLNLERRKKLVDLFEEHKPDLLFHFAAYAAEGLSPFIRNYNYRNNLICSANLINECIKQNTKVVFTSSMEKGNLINALREASKKNCIF